MVYRVYVEKKSTFSGVAENLKTELITIFGIKRLTGVRIIQRYDIEGIDEQLFDKAVCNVLSEPPVDVVTRHIPKGDFICAVEYIPGQFDQRASSAAECIQLISKAERPVVLCAKLFVFTGKLSDSDKAIIEKHLINPVESRRADLSEKATLKTTYPAPAKPETITGFTKIKPCERGEIIKRYALAMDISDLSLCIDYFSKENRDPTITELRVLDTYWSDHCRHTTFGTIIDNVEISPDDNDIQIAYNNYLDIRKKLNIEKPVTLMDIATIGAKYIHSMGKLKNWDRGPENNACSIKINVDNNGTNEEWLLLFKNETHNHPTEIEPEGGAATCIGGAIRDPLSGRSYVYQAMRVTGAANPLAPVNETLTGKLPQRKIVTSAANGYSSYGNQIGLATGLVEEFYHEGYKAKRMEIGAVLGAVALSGVRREEPAAGDVVILVGGRTGRDGCGGATGSSKAHKTESLETCGAEVQKGNAPCERKLQRLFRNPAAMSLIKRCNDFGAGGVAVAIGELADGMEINLDKIPKKYDGLNGTELAISESQERMAVVVEADKACDFINFASQENLEAQVVATITEIKRLVMMLGEEKIVDISREFINTNGAEKHTNVVVGKEGKKGRREEGKILNESIPPSLHPSIPCIIDDGEFHERLLTLAQDINVCSKKGLFERFDSTIGSGSVLMPAGGAFQLTPAQVMAAKIPVLNETTTCSGMSFGFDPFISEQNPFEGAYIAVMQSLAKLIASGFPSAEIVLSFQEYFCRLGNDAKRWALPFTALLGALQAQVDFGVAAIGGKDSMSGSFENLDVPPTLVSFAVTTGNTANIISGEFKKAGNVVLWIRPFNNNKNSLRPKPDSFLDAAHFVEKLIAEKKAISAWTPSRFGVAEGILKMCFGNKIGFDFTSNIFSISNAKNVNTESAEYFKPAFGSFIIEIKDTIDITGIIPGNTNFDIFAIGSTISDYKIIYKNENADLNNVQKAWESKLETVFPYQNKPESYSPGLQIQTINYKTNARYAKHKHIRPRALIPVFPGTNCEYDTARALHRAGAEADIFVVRNLTPQAVAESSAELAKRITQSQLLIIPGGFSGGDEPDGSAKLIAAFFRGTQVQDAVMNLLQRDGLILGICNGFQALIKLGLVPFGEIREIDESCPTLTFNKIGRHQSMMVSTRIASNLSPWFLCEEVGNIHTIPVSHGEGRFTANPQWLKRLEAAGLIATQYVDKGGNPAMQLPYNPNGSDWAIEGITSPCGRVLGKMGHSERSGLDLYKNIPGKLYQKLFEGGVRYFA